VSDGAGCRVGVLARGRELRAGAAKAYSLQIRNSHKDSAKPRKGKR